MADIITTGGAAEVQDGAPVGARDAAIRAGPVPNGRGVSEAERRRDFRRAAQGEDYVAGCDGAHTPDYIAETARGASVVCAIFSNADASQNGAMGYRAKPPKSSEIRKLITARFAAAAEAYKPVQAELARDLGIDARQLNGYMRGKNYPDEAVVVRFCALSGCTADWIYLGKLDGLPGKLSALIAHNHPELLGLDCVPAGTPPGRPPKMAVRRVDTKKMVAGHGTTAKRTARAAS